MRFADALKHLVDADRWLLDRLNGGPLSQGVVIAPGRGGQLVAGRVTGLEYLTIRWADAKTEQVKCRSQMSAIAQAVFMYANNNHGQLPPDLRAVAVEEDITPFIFVCPDSTDTPARSLVAMATPGHLSYFYLRAGSRVSDVKSPEQTVMIYESANHFGGMNVTFYDGHMGFVPRRNAQKVCAELRAGQNPPAAMNNP